MSPISVTLAVLNLLRSRLARLVQFKNIDAMSLTFEVLRYDKPVILVIAAIPSNHPWHEVGLALAKEELNTTFVMLLRWSYHPGVSLPVFIP